MKQHGLSKSELLIIETSGFNCCTDGHDNYVHFFNRISRETKHDPQFPVYEYVYQRGLVMGEDCRGMGGNIGVPEPDHMV